MSSRAIASQFLPALFLGASATLAVRLALLRAWRWSPFFFSYIVLLVLRATAWLAGDWQNANYLWLASPLWLIMCVSESMTQTAALCNERRMSVSQFCWMMGISASIIVIANDPKQLPFPVPNHIVSMIGYTWHTGVQVMCFGALLLRTIWTLVRHERNACPEVALHQSILLIYVAACVVASILNGQETWWTVTIGVQLVHICCLTAWHWALHTRRWV